MLLRSVLALALLLAAAAAAQSAGGGPDVFLSFYVNATNSTVKMCAVDSPTRCVFVPKLPKINITLAIEEYNKTWALLVDGRSRVVEYHPPDYELLQYVVHSFSNTPPLTIQVPVSGILYSSRSFYVDGRQAQTGYPSVCNRTFSYAYSVSPGTYTISGLREALYLLDTRTCLSYRVVESISRVVNLTGKIQLYIFHMPTAYRKYIRTTAIGGYNIYAFNATQHAYFIHIYTWGLIGGFVSQGMYLANSTWLPTIVISTYYRQDILQSFSYGSVHYSTYRNSTASLSTFALLTIGQAPGDGIIRLWFPTRGRMHVGYIADGTVGYVNFSNALPRDLLIYVRRYSLAEVYVANATHSYVVRLMACTAYSGEHDFVFTRPIMFVPTNRIYEVEICNNMTSTYYVGLYVYYSATIYGYTYIDELQPGTCRRLRWDAFYSNTYVTFRFFNSTRNMCRLRPEFSVAGTKCPAGWRCVLRNRDLVAVHPIEPDALYAAMWQEFMKYLTQQYNATMNALMQWLQMQANATKSIQDFIASQPRIIGTVRVESATSVWLQTVLSEIKRYAVPAPPSTGGGFAPAPLPGASSLSAAAAAAAVATAWAASRRSLASAAFLAGFAVLASALFVYYLYGTSVATGLIVAAVVLMSLGAAAAWFRKTED